MSVFDGWQPGDDIRRIPFGKYDIANANDRKSIRNATHLLPDPGGEVARALLDRIDQLETGRDQARELESRVSDYFAAGGFWTPDLNRHGKVRDFMLDLRAFLRQIAGEPK